MRKLREMLVKKGRLPRKEGTPERKRRKTKRSEAQDAEGILLYLGSSYYNMFSIVP